jgi:recombination protein RecA
MPTHNRSTALKREIESRLASRIPGALSPLATQSPRLLAFRIAALEALLGGGLSIGGITEFTGPASSGLTSIAFSVLSEATLDAACAYIDASDSFDPGSAAAAGVCLANLLWVRVASVSENKTPQPNLKTKSTAAKSVEAVPVTGRSSSYHPRTETRGLDRALQTMLVQKAEARLKKAEGTPGYPNQKLSLLSVPDDQVEYEHFNARRADNSDPLRRMDREAAVSARERARIVPAPHRQSRVSEKPWSRLEKAIRATDQVLLSGGFRVVVLDLAGVPAEQSLRIPAATWFRFRRATQEADAVLVLLTRQPCARSSASCVVECSPLITNRSESTLLGGFQHAAEVVRQRANDAQGKKAPGRVASWEATSPWMRAVGK